MRSKLFSALFIICFLLVTTKTIFAAPPRLMVSANKRFLVTETGAPFFWQGDTAWQLQRATPQEVVTYFNDRAAKGFTVIQGPTLTGDTDAKTGTNYNGQRNDNPSSPNEAWFSHIDYIVTQAESRNMYMAMVVIWATNDYRITSPSQAYTYGQWLGNRYKDKNNIIWIVAGEYAAASLDSNTLNKWKQLALGLKNGSQNRHLVTIHGSWGPDEPDQTSSTYFHNETWLDFNMWQTGQGGQYVTPWTMIGADYNKTPTKPVVDGEPTYEGVWEVTKNDVGRWDATGVRRRAYWAVFSGAFGHTYGAHGIWDWHKPGESSTTADQWSVALAFEGSGDMQHLKNLTLSRPFLTRVPDQSVLNSSAGSESNHIHATRSTDGNYAFVYIPTNQTVTINMTKITGSQIKAWWYDPRNGTAQTIGTYPNTGTKSFTTPSGGPDWILVLDNLDQNFGTPGVVNGVQPTQPAVTSTPTRTPTATRTPTPWITTPTKTPTITPTSNQPNPSPTGTSIIPNPPSWFSELPDNLKNFLEQLYLTVYFFQLPSNLAHLLEGIVAN